MATKGTPKKGTKRDRFGPDRPDAIALSRRVRMWSLIGTWLFILVFFAMPITFGNLLFVVPTVFFGALMIATMRGARRTDSPDAECLERGELARATPAEPVVVRGVWSLGARVRGEAPPRGLLACDGTRIWFESDAGDVRMDAPIRSLGLGGRPSFMRPQLDLVVDGVPQTVRLFPNWDLGASFVGPIVCGEWYAQLRELGAR